MKAAHAFLLWLAMAAPAFAADASAPHPGEPARLPPAASQSVVSQPATEITGFVSPMQGAGICMDGATHLVHSADGDFRRLLDLRLCRK